MMFIKKRNIIILGIIILIIGSAICSEIWNRSELRKNGKLLTGRIISERRGSKSIWWFTYEFRYNNKLYKKDKSVDVVQSWTFVGKSFPVIFSPRSNRCELVITPRDFEIYRLPFPDSLSWVKRYVDKNKYRF